ncbi:hypothetical protein, partial [Stenotrophomonas sp. CASM114]|uniref:hypothetical protein n=1 Tax=Stenotrophomonas sp. CASM114 TaxID=3111512 RepID=UPI003BF91773
VRNLKYVVIGLVILSVAFAVIMDGSAFAWGGAVGDMIKVWMINTIGSVGTYAVLGVAVLSYIIWRFNPAFKIPGSKEAQAGVEPLPEEIIAPVEFAVEDNKGNALKNGVGAMVAPPATNATPQHDLQIVEKEIEPIAAVEEEDDSD